MAGGAYGAGPLRVELANASRDPTEEVISVPGVRVKEGESFERAMRRFKKQCERAGILGEIRKREYYEKPSVRRKEKAAAARKRLIKKMKKEGQL